MDNIRLYDAFSIDTLLPANDEDAKQVKEYFLPIFKQQIKDMIQNVDAKIFILKIDDLLLPITVNEKEYDNAYVASNYVSVQLLKEYVDKLKSPFISFFAKPVMSLLGLLLKGIKINKMVYVNNWLCSTCLQPELSLGQVERLTGFLTKHFQDHMILFRSLHDYKGEHLLASLKKVYYRLVCIRQIYFFDYQKEHLFDNRAKRHHKSDSTLARKENYQVIEKEELQESDYARILRLYQMVYIDKYTRYSPEFTENFLKGILGTPNIFLRALKKNGKIDGFVALFKKNHEMIICFLGYDTSLPQALGMYRMIMDLALQEAKKMKILLNLSSGSDTFKTLRGMLKKPEYLAVFDRHLPLYRQALWFMAEMFTRIRAQTHRYKRFDFFWDKIMKAFVKKRELTN